MIGKWIEGLIKIQLKSKSIDRIFLIAQAPAHARAAQLDPSVPLEARIDAVDVAPSDNSRLSSSTTPGLPAANLTAPGPWDSAHYVVRAAVPSSGSTVVEIRYHHPVIKSGGVVSLALPLARSRESGAVQGRVIDPETGLGLGGVPVFVGQTAALSAPASEPSSAGGSGAGSGRGRGGGGGRGRGGGGGSGGGGLLFLLLPGGGRRVPMCLSGNDKPLTFSKPYQTERRKGRRDVST